MCCCVLRGLLYSYAKFAFAHLSNLTSDVKYIHGAFVELFFFPLGY